MPMSTEARLCGDYGAGQSSAATGKRDSVVTRCRQAHGTTSIGRAGDQPLVRSDSAELKVEFVRRR